MDSTLLSDQRSLAYHQAVAARLRADPARLEEARARLERWASEGGRSSHLFERWADVLSGDLQGILELLEDPGPEATELRHSSPFAGMIEPRERWRIWRRVRESIRESIEVETE